MNKNNNEELKKSLATGGSAAVGAVVGVMAGSAIASPEASPQDLTSNKIEAEITPVDAEENVDQVIAQEVAHEPAKPAQPVQHIQSEVTVPEEEGFVEEVTLVEPQVELIEYGTVQYEDGSTADVAIVDVDGTVAAYMDVTGDGKADVAMVDLNDDGEIQDEEVFDVSSQNIQMSMFEQMTPQSELFADNDMPDYVNDADAGIYMA